MKRFFNPDILAGVASMAWAVLGVTVLPELAELMDPKLAGGFAVVALGRGYRALKKATADGKS